MQIHELTKRQKQLDEGILSGLKAAVNVAKTGADKFASAMVPGYDDVKDAIATGKAGYAKGAESGKGKWAGIKQAAKNLADPRASGQAKNTRLQKQSDKDLDSIDKKYNIKSKRPLNWYKEKVKQDPDLTKDRDKLVPSFDQTFDLGPALPDAGRVLTVSLNNAAYYKDGSGNWYQEPEADTPDAKARPITSPTSVQSLEDLIDNDQYSQMAIPPSMGGAAVPKTKSTKQTQPAANQLQQSALTQGIQEARGVAQPGKFSKQAAQRNVAPQAKQITPTLVSKPAKSAGKLKLRKGFNDWIAKAMPEFNSVSNDPEIKRELIGIFNKLLANKDDVKISNELFKQYLVTIQAGALRAKAGAQGGDTEQQPQSDVEATLAQLRGKTGNKTNIPQIDQILQQQGIRLSESQVAITKDIVVKTNSGNYTKKQSDQQWYDPNGAWIDPDKYADYIAKLDKTPAAQTRYQADAVDSKGTDDSYIKQQQDNIENALDNTEDDPYRDDSLFWNAFEIAYEKTNSIVGRRELAKKGWLVTDKEKKENAEILVTELRKRNIDIDFDLATKLLNVINLKDKVQYSGYETFISKRAKRRSAEGDARWKEYQDWENSLSPKELANLRDLEQKQRDDDERKDREQQQQAQADYEERKRMSADYYAKTGRIANGPNAIHSIYESQVAITKDIVVKTKSGDYVKRHTDQQWYDPNGVRIDADKYADYIARLDKTPAAQTRYQADAKKGTGSADSFIKSQPKSKAPELDEPAQHATAADWEAYKAQQNAIQNQLIDQTVNDLRNAEYFKTGQEHYLQQQLAQLMAKKF